MSDNSNKPNGLFWAISIIAFIWNGMGVMNYINQAYMTDEMLEALPELQRELIENRPSWATGAFAIAVFGGFFGSILLLLKKKLSFTLFSLSFIGVLVQMVYNLMNTSLQDYGAALIGLTVMILGLAVFLMFYSKQCAKKGWLS